MRSVPYTILWLNCYKRFSSATKRWISHPLFKHGTKVPILIPIQFLAKHSNSKMFAKQCSEIDVYVKKYLNTFKTKTVPKKIMPIEN